MDALKVCPKGEDQRRAESKTRKRIIAEPLVDQTLQEIGEVYELYRRLILMVGPAGSRKTFQTSLPSSKQWQACVTGYRVWQQELAWQEYKATRPATSFSVLPMSARLLCPSR